MQSQLYWRGIKDIADDSETFVKNFVLSVAKRDFNDFLNTLFSINKKFRDY